MDANKDDVRPGYVLTSVLKNTDVPVKDLLTQYLDGKIKDSDLLLNYTLKSQATGITDLKTISEKIKPEGKETWDEILAKLETVQKDIEGGSIKITNAQIGEAFDPSSLSNITIK